MTLVRNLYGRQVLIRLQIARAPNLMGATYGGTKLKTNNYTLLPVRRGSNLTYVRGT
jgi:hypothetical protein